MPPLSRETVHDACEPTEVHTSDEHSRSSVTTQYRQQWCVLPTVMNQCDNQQSLYFSLSLSFFVVVTMYWTKKTSATDDRVKQDLKTKTLTNSFERLFEFQSL